MSNVSDMSDEELLRILRRRANDDHKITACTTLINMFSQSMQHNAELTPGLTAAIALTKLYSRTLKAGNGRLHPFLDFPATTTVASILKDASAMIPRPTPKDPPHVKAHDAYQEKKLGPAPETGDLLIATLPPRRRFRSSEGKPSKVSLCAGRILTLAPKEFGHEDCRAVCSDLNVARSDVNNAVYHLVSHGLIFRIGFKSGRYRVAPVSDAHAGAGTVQPVARDA